jgi:hypothetical protein
MQPFISGNLYRRHTVCAQENRVLTRQYPRRLKAA